MCAAHLRRSPCSTAESLPLSCSPRFRFVLIREALKLVFSAAQAQGVRPCQVYFIPGHTVTIPLRPGQAEKCSPETCDREALQHRITPDQIFLDDQFAAPLFGDDLFESPDRTVV